MAGQEKRQNEHAAILQASPLFLDLRADEVALLAELCQEAAFTAGETIFRVDEPGDCLYIVKDGEVEVLHDGAAEERRPQVIAVLGRGEFFGEMSMLEKSTRSATVRARADAQLLVLTTEDFYSFAKIFKDGFTVVIINIARILSQRLRQTTGRLRGL